ncbi:oleate hydratase [Kocuria rhizophila]|nr:oleate hydratase [Kocuria rhizophila]
MHHIGGLPDFSALKFSPEYNQYESSAPPLISHHGARRHLPARHRRPRHRLLPPQRRDPRHRDHLGARGRHRDPGVGEHDLVFTTIGSLVDNSDHQDHATPAKLDRGPASAWDLWKRWIAAKDPLLSGARRRLASIDETSGVRHRHHPGPADPRDTARSRSGSFSGRVVTGGDRHGGGLLVAAQLDREPPAPLQKQPKDQIVVWVNSLFGGHPRDSAEKTMAEVHGPGDHPGVALPILGVPVGGDPELAATGAKTVPVMMPDRDQLLHAPPRGGPPAGGAQGARNFAFLGQFAETGRDGIFTTEYSVRTGMEAAYQLMGVERAFPRRGAGTYDARVLLGRPHPGPRDGERSGSPGRNRCASGCVVVCSNREVGELLEEYGVL